MTPGDNPPVGILLCTQKNHPLVEYALAGIDNQLFVSILFGSSIQERPRRAEGPQAKAGKVQEAALCDTQSTLSLRLGTV